MRLPSHYAGYACFAYPRAKKSYECALSLLANVQPEQRREWRTPPLWGVRDSAPYLHDGRAQTFAEAIVWHGGEAAPAARSFRGLEEQEKSELIVFLKCLTAPAPESLALERVALTDTVRTPEFDAP